MHIPLKKNKKTNSHIGHTLAMAILPLSNARVASPYGSNNVSGKCKREWEIDYELYDKTKMCCIVGRRKTMGKGKLAGKTLKILKNYYGMVIRQNSKNSDLKDRPKFCPIKGISWCLWHPTS